eukprot:CAMPEP_0184706830 /NCGR_PEP_ID=MMETSP0313-20130426/36961_1 /TAXON_ID=2792 /ORGANISM="Porphyridium aerugineum, Strain SAG 1380-2" /LENGTH=137 /DNA_ID=CAMNT_0027168397 /DNA_START=1090 /DNA_END=1503 /DNA_ORIENTATION=-
MDNYSSVSHQGKPDRLVSNSENSAKSKPTVVHEEMITMISIMANICPILLARLHVSQSKVETQSGDRMHPNACNSVVGPPAKFRQGRTRTYNPECAARSRRNSRKLDHAPSPRLRNSQEGSSLADSDAPELVLPNEE